MPLSEGATRARHARRLLQRVLDFAPEGTAIHPIVRIGRHAAEGIVEAAAEQEADLIIFGWGGKAPAGRDGTARRSSRRRSTRSSASRRATSRSSSSAARRRSGGSSSRSAAAPTRSSPSASPTRSPGATTPTVGVLHFVPPGITLAVRAQAEHALAQFVRQHVTRQGRGRSSARRPTSGTRSCARRRRPTSSSWARRPSRPAPTARRTCSARCRRRSPPGPSRPSSSSRPARRSAARRSSSSPPRAETLAAADRAAEEARAVPARVERWFGEANFHHAEFADLAPARPAQGEAGPDGLARPADARRGGDDRADRPARDARDDGPRPARSTRSSSSTPTSTDRTREIAEAEGARVVQHPDVLPRYGSFRGKGEALWKSRLRDERRHHRLGRHRRPQLAPADGLRDARPAAPRAAPAVRQGLLPAPDRRGRRAQGGRRRPGHGARRAAADQPLLPRAVGADPAARRASTRGGARCSSRSRSSPATPSRSGT